MSYKTLKCSSVHCFFIKVLLRQEKLMFTKGSLPWGVKPIKIRSYPKHYSEKSAYLERGSSTRRKIWILGWWCLSSWKSYLVSLETSGLQRVKIVKSILLVRSFLKSHQNLTSVSKIYHPQLPRRKKGLLWWGYIGPFSSSIWDLPGWTLEWCIPKIFLY